MARGRIGRAYGRGSIGWAYGTRQYKVGLWQRQYRVGLWHEAVYLLTAWSRVLLEKLTGFAANQEIPRILWKPKVHYRTHKRPPPAPILSQLHPVPTTPSHFLKIHLNIILPSTAWSPQWSLSLRFPHEAVFCCRTDHVVIRHVNTDICITIAVCQ